MTKTQQSKKTDTKQSLFTARNISWAVGGIVGLALIVWLAASIASEGEVDESIAFGEVTVEGQALPFLADATTTDPALGQVAPTVMGEDWNGNQYTIGPDGTPKIVVFLAHWCPHCQAEVPDLQSWLDNGGLPDDVDLYSATVLTDRLRPNWPPQDWLMEEGWTPPVLMDDQAGSIVQAYGMRGTPFYVVLDGENRNLGRFSGQVGVQGLETMVAIARTGLDG